MSNPYKSCKGLPQNGRTVEQFRRFRPVREMPNMSKKAIHGLVLSLGKRESCFNELLFHYFDLREPTAFAKRFTDLRPFSLN